jgi:ankyrin repeat protein
MSFHRPIFAGFFLVAAALSDVGAATKKAVQDPDCQHPPGAVSKLRDKFEDACCDKNEEVALALISKGLLINEEDENKNTPLSLAVRAPMPKVAARLIELGANVNAETDYRTTVLTSAIAGGSTDIVALLLAHGSEVNHLTKNGYTPLMEAAGRGNAGMVQFLIKRGANPAQLREDGKDALFLAASNGNGEMVQLLAKEGCKVDGVDSDGNTPLLMASMRGSLAAVQALVECGADLNAAGQNRYGITPLTTAAWRKPHKQEDYVGIIRYLISRGAKLDVPDGSGNTSIMAAAKVGAAENIRALVAGGVDVKAPGSDVAKAFLGAVHDSRYETVAAFLELGLNPDSCRPASKEELSPLFYAVQVNRNEKMVKLLLDAGSDPNATRRFLPICSGFIVGTPPEPREIEQSVLIAAVQSNNPAIVKLLVAAGANADYRDTDGKTALDRARELKLEQIVEILSAAPKSAEGDDSVKRLKAARQLPVKAPVSTPYDSDPQAREVYLEEYRAGYRSILAAVDIICHMGVKGPTFEAFQAGWSDGKKAATKDHPEKAAEIMGVPLEDYPCLSG